MSVTSRSFIKLMGRVEALEDMAHDHSGGGGLDLAKRVEELCERVDNLVESVAEADRILEAEINELVERFDELADRVDELETDGLLGNELFEQVGTLEERVGDLEIADTDNNVHVRDLDEVITVDDGFLADNEARIVDGVLFVGRDFLELFDEAIEAAST